MCVERRSSDHSMRGEPAAVVVSKDEYERLKHPKESFVDFMRNSPLYGVDIDLTREQTLTRTDEPL